MVLQCCAVMFSTWMQPIENGSCVLCDQGSCLSDTLLYYFAINENVPLVFLCRGLLNECFNVVRKQG